MESPSTNPASGPQLTGYLYSTDCSKHFCLKGYSSLLFLEDWSKISLLTVTVQNSKNFFLPFIMNSFVPGTLVVYVWYRMNTSNTQNFLNRNWMKIVQLYFVDFHAYFTSSLVQLYKL